MYEWGMPAHLIPVPLNRVFSRETNIRDAHPPMTFEAHPKDAGWNGLLAKEGLAKFI